MRCFNRYGGNQYQKHSKKVCTSHGSRKKLVPSHKPSSQFHLCNMHCWFRNAVVTGANKGIGLEICRQLASNGVEVILTARDEQGGIEAVENLRQSGVSNFVFHQLDVKDSASAFIETHFGKLDILVTDLMF